MADKKPRDFSFLLKENPTISSQSVKEGGQQTDTKTNPNVSSSNDASGDDFEGDISAIMGFGGFGKQKASKSKKVEEEDDEDSLEAIYATLKSGHSSGGGPSSSSSSRPKASALDQNDGSEGFHGPPNPSSSSSNTRDNEGEKSTKEGASDDNDNEDDDEDDDDDFGDFAPEEGSGASVKAPVSHQVVLHHGKKAVYALSVDPAGSRFATGSNDYSVKLWDFGGMDKSMKAFRDMVPAEGYPVRSLAFSNSGDMILVGTGKAQAKVLDRDGKEVFECLKGDQYIHDLARTHGHVLSINTVQWHPTYKEWFLTGSDDGTVRIWDINNHRSSVFVAKSRTKLGRRTPVTASTLSRDGKTVAAACMDGSLQLFALNDQSLRSTQSKYGAHEEDRGISSVLFTPDGRTLLSRSKDGTLKAWDMRNFTKPFQVVADLPNNYDTTNVIMSPDERYIITGTSLPLKQEEEGEGSGRLVFIDRFTFQPVLQLGMPGTSVVQTHWHAKINQLFVTLSNGDVKLFFDPDKSVKGAKLCLAREPRKVDALDFWGDHHGAIVAPNAFRGDQALEREKNQSAKRKRDKARRDPKTSKLPELPVDHNKFGHREGRVYGYATSLSQHLAKEAGIMAYDSSRDQDPREAILRHAEAAEKNPFYIAPAYKKNQPNAVFDTTVDEDEDDTSASKKRKFDPNKRKY